MRKRIVILGSTGSIGENTLRIVAEHPAAFEVVGLVADRNDVRVLEQAAAFGVRRVALRHPAAAARARAAAPAGLEVLAGPTGVVDLAVGSGADLVVGAIVGMAGLQPVLEAVRRGLDVALATKEVLVAAGGLVTAAARASGARLLPVDSEPSAIFQCVADRPDQPLRRLILTASGGPFAARPDLDLATVTVEQALNHPRWNMGRKVTIDSATLMNKGLEVLECRWLFDLPLERIEVLIHPESLVHSLVEFVDGSVLAQLGPPDMRVPIQYALTHPARLPGDRQALDLAAVGRLHFGAPDVERFPCLRLARAAGEAGGTAPAVLNAANEVAVHAFLAGQLPFPGIWGIVETVLSWHHVTPDPDLEHVLGADGWARRAAEECVACWK